MGAAAPSQGGHGPRHSTALPAGPQGQPDEGAGGGAGHGETPPLRPHRLGAPAGSSVMFWEQEVLGDEACQWVYVGVRRGGTKAGGEPWDALSAFFVSTTQPSICSGGQACGNAGRPSTNIWEEKHQKINNGYLWVVRSEVASISFFSPVFPHYCLIAWILEGKKCYFFLT